MKEGARPIYNNVKIKDAVRYDRHVEQSPMYQSMVKKLIEIADIKPGQKVLCLAGGTGLDAREVLKNNPNIILTDLAFPMLKAAKKNKNNKVKGLVESDAVNIPFKEQTFDHIVINAGGEYILQHLDQVFQEAYRVLRPGGNITFNCQTDELGVSYPGDPQRALRKEVEELAKQKLGINILASKPKSLYSVEDIKNMAKNLGIKNDQLECEISSDEALPASIFDSQRQLSLEIFNSKWMTKVPKRERTGLIEKAAQNLTNKVASNEVNLDNVRHWYYFKFVKN